MKKMIATIISIIAGIIMTVTLIMINCFGVMALYDVMSTATLLFIISGMYLVGYSDARKEDDRNQD